MDKYLAKALFQAADLPIVDDVLIAAGTQAEAAADDVRKRLGDQVVIKPRRQGSALGVTLLPKGGDLVEPLRDALEFGGGALVERHVSGREATVGVLDEHGSRAVALPVIEVKVATGEWYDFDNRYTPGRSEHLVPAPFPQACLRRLEDYALRAHRCLGLRDFSRADFVVGDEIWLLEVNALPGMTSTSLYPGCLSRRWNRFRRGGGTTGSERLATGDRTHGEVTHADPRHPKRPPWARSCSRPNDPCVVSKLAGVRADAPTWVGVPYVGGCPLRVGVPCGWVSPTWVGVPCGWVSPTWVGVPCGWVSPAGGCPLSGGCPLILMLFPTMKTILESDEWRNRSTR